MAVKKASGTQGTEVVIGSAAISLNRATAELGNAVNSVNGLQEKATQLALNIDSREQRIVELDNEYAEKKRKLEVELELDVRQNEDDVVIRVLADQGKVPVDVDDWTELEDRYNNLKRDFEENVRKEVGKAEGIAKSRYEKEKELSQAEFKAQEAKNTAQIEQLNLQVTFLTSQLGDWKRALDEERKASIERAKASSIGTIQVGSNEPTGRR